MAGRCYRCARCWAGAGLTHVHEMRVSPPPLRALRSSCARPLSLSALPMLLMVRSVTQDLRRQGGLGRKVV